MRRSIVSIMLFLTLICGTIIGPLTGTALAATAANCSGESSNFLRMPTWYKYLSPRFDGSDCKVTFEFPQDVGKILLAVVEILLRVSGLVAVGFVVYGGIKYILSQGSPDKTKNAKNTIVNALVGAGLSIIAVGLVNLVARTLIS